MGIDSDLNSPDGAKVPDLLRLRETPLRVIHLVLSLDVGGLERVVLDLIREGRRLGQEVAVICLERPGVLAPEAELMGCPVFCTHKPPGFRPGICRMLTSILKEFAPDLVHTHQIGALIYAGPAARRARISAVVHTEHNNHFAKNRWKIGSAKILRMRALWWLAARYSDRFICVSVDACKSVIRNGIVPERKVTVIPNGIDLGKFSGSNERQSIRAAIGIPENAPVVGTIGRLTAIKRQDILVSVFPELLCQFPTAHLLIVGDGPSMANLRDLVAQLRLEARVHLLGYQPHPEFYLQTMDVFAQTSSIEGMPLAVIEAWAAGVPVIATRVGGLPEMIDHDRTGMLYDYDDRRCLLELLSQLLADPSSARRIGEAGHELAKKNFSSEVMAGKYFGEYRAILSSRLAKR